jgi:hypothetical protein
MCDWQFNYTGHVRTMIPSPLQLPLFSAVNANHPSTNNASKKCYICSCSQVFRTIYLLLKHAQTCAVRIAKQAFPPKRGDTLPVFAGLKTNRSRNVAVAAFSKGQPEQPSNHGSRKRCIYHPPGRGELLCFTDPLICGRSRENFYQWNIRIKIPTAPLIAENWLILTSIENRN